VITVGAACLFLALGVAIYGAVAALAGTRGDRRFTDSARRAVYAFAALITVCVVVIELAFARTDLSLQVVAEHSSTTTPGFYKLTAMWSSQEGSLLLWAWVLSLTSAAVLYATRTKYREIAPWATAVLMGLGAFFAGLMLFEANPFARLDPAPAEGVGLNPLLRHPAMAIHPPMLYSGYVFFSIPFAFAIGALVTRRLDASWIRATRRFALIAWLLLGIGIMLGARWSYSELGWGGYWGWDPVENASLMPWLVGTAFLHSIMVQERRGMLRVWNLSLLCATFSLTILGTFLTRSGVLESVHAFSDGDIGAWLLGFFVLIVAVSLGLIGWRGDRLRAPGQIDSPVSREGAFLANNVVFAGFAFVVLLGTVFPLIVEAVNGDQLSVGAPYFERMTMPIGITLLFLMAVAPVLPWRKASGELLAQRLFWPAWVGTGAVVVAVLLGAHGLAPLLAFGLGGFAAGSALRQLGLAARRQGWRGVVGRTNGGMVVHLGVVLIAVALAASSSYDTERELTMDVDDSATVAGHEITYVGPRTVEQPNKTSIRARVSIDGHVYEPAINRFGEGETAVGTPAVATSPTRDVYLALLQVPDEDNAGRIVLRVVVQPLVLWLWIGGAVMLIGTVLAAFPGRRRSPIAPVSEPPRAVTGAPVAAPSNGDGQAGSADDAPVEVPT
jgi:cytochrome c-type biogenesis protein CcmF